MIGLKTILNRIMDFLNAYSAVGSIYITTSETNPAEVFGGNWQKIEGKILMGAGTNTYTYKVGNSGGSADKIIPKHNHACGYWSAGSGGSYSVFTKTTKRQKKSITIGNPLNGTTSIGASAINANLPPYFVVHIWKRIS